MGEVKPRILPNGSVYYPNPPAKVVLMVWPICWFLLGSAIGLPFFLAVFEPIMFMYLGIPTMAITALFLLLFMGRWLVLSVRIGQGYVVLRYLLRTRRLGAADVNKITLDPPVYSGSLKYRYWGEPDSVCWVEFQDGRKISISLLPNGIKLRMARVLDPQNFPVIE